MKTIQGRDDVHPSFATRNIGTPLPEQHSGLYLASE